MSICGECGAFFSIAEDDQDFQPGMGDCVRQQEDSKCKFWTSKPTMADKESECPEFAART